MHRATGLTVAEPPLNSVRKCLGEELWDQRLGSSGEGRQPAQRPLPSGPFQGLGPSQGKGIFQLDQLLSRNRVGERNVPHGIGKSAGSLISPPGAFMSGLSEGLTWNVMPWPRRCHEMPGKLES